MAVRVQKSAVNIREKLAELERPIGLKGSELMRAETVQEARDFVSAGRKNLVINGDLKVWQRGTSATLNNSSSQTVKSADRWNHYHSTDGSVTEERSTDVPTGQGFYYSLKHTVATADSSIAATQYHAHRYDIEGYDVAHLMWGTSYAKPITVSFWVKSSLAGDYGFCIRPGANLSRFYADTLTITQANTWEYKTFTVPGCPDGTWEKTTSAGLEVQISHSMGTTYQTSSLRQWTSSLVVSPTTQVNWMGTVGNTWYITGLQVEVGKNATEFEFRSYGQELALCQRYYFSNWGIEGTTLSASEEYQTIGALHRIADSNSSFKAAYFVYPVPMRADPSITLYNGTTADQVALQTSTGTTGTAVGQAYNITPYGFMPGNYNGTSVGSSGSSLAVSFKIQASAEL